MVTGGDFNSIRFSYEKLRLNFHINASKKFNSFLEDFNLFEYELSSRKYNWSNVRQFALLDRLLGNL
jgi:hypothetical protein